MIPLIKSCIGVKGHVLDLISCMQKTDWTTEVVVEEICRS